MFLDITQTITNITQTVTNLTELKLYEVCSQTTGKSLEDDREPLKIIITLVCNDHGTKEELDNT